MRKIPPIFIAWIAFFFFPIFVFCQQTNEKIDSLLKLLEIAKEDTNKVKTLDDLAFLFWNTKNLSKAKEYGNHSLNLAKKINDRKGEALAYSHLAVILQNSHDGSDDLSIKYSFEAIEIYKEMDNKDRLAKEYSNLAVAYCNINNYPDGIKHYINALKVYESIGNKFNIAMATAQVGNIYLKSDDFFTSLKYLNTALDIFIGIGNNEGKAMCYELMQDVYWKQGNYSLALESSMIALKIRETYKDKRKMAICYNSIGLIYKEQKKYDEALKNYTAGLALRQELKDKIGIGIAYGNIGNIYSDRGNRHEALSYYNSAIKIFEESRYKNGLAACFNNIGNVYEAEKKYDEANNYYMKALKIREEIQDRNGLTSSFINMGSLNIKLNKYPEAKKYLNEALLLSKELGTKENIKLSYEVLAELDSIENNYKSAYENYKMFVTYRDSLESNENIEKITRLQMQYDFDKKEDSLKYQQQITDEKLKQQTLLTLQQQQSLLLKARELALISKEKDLQRLEYFKTQAELQAEQSKRKENEDQLTIAGQEKSLQKTKLDLQATQLGLQNKELQAKKTQRNIFIAGTIALLLLAFFIFRNFQNQQKANKLMKVAAEKERIELQLQSLRAQLNPHFMFNSLNAIQELIVMEENEKSQSYLERFAKLLRMLLENANEPFIPLRKEVNFLELYLSLEKLRLPDLEYSIEIDPQIDQQKAMTPNMMLQPYVENALWHGLQHKQGEKTLRLHIVKQNGSLEYEIQDNGVGRKRAEDLKSTYRKEHRSKGMELLSQRFNLLSKEYGQNIQTTITDLTDSGNASGTLVKITIPYSIEPDPKPVS